MSTPGFTATSGIRRGAALPSVGSAPWQQLRPPMQVTNLVVAESYPAECHGAQGFTKTSCYGVVQMCQDCCQRWSPGSGYHDVCGDSYVCGACLGFDW